MCHGSSCVGAVPKTALAYFCVYFFFFCVFTFACIPRHFLPPLAGAQVRLRQEPLRRIPVVSPINDRPCQLLIHSVSATRPCCLSTNLASLCTNQHQPIAPQPTHALLHVFCCCHFSARVLNRHALRPGLDVRVSVARADGDGIPVYVLHTTGTTAMARSSVNSSWMKSSWAAPLLAGAARFTSRPFPVAAILLQEVSNTKWFSARVAQGCSEAHCRLSRPALSLSAITHSSHSCSSGKLCVCEGGQFV